VLCAYAVCVRICYFFILSTINSSGDSKNSFARGSMLNFLNCFLQDTF
jgi:hypothetical protein